MAAERETPTEQNPPKAVVIHKARWHQRLAAFLLYQLIRAIGSTVRYRLNDNSGFFSHAPREKLIFAVWHNRLALALILYQRYVSQRSPERRLACLISASRDGGLIARVLELFGGKPVRGSSSRRGPQALRELISWGQHGYDLAITPDGPRGPVYHVQEGVISTAQLTGLVIVPVSYHLNRKIRMKSWDRFMVPLPFATCEITVAQPIRVPRDLTDSQREDFRIQLEHVMREITKD